MLMGTFPSNVGLAVADLANQRRFPFLAAEPLTDKIVWENGNAWTFRLRASTYMQTAMLVPEAAKLGKKRWVIVYPNYEYGQAATATFKQQMIARQARRPRVRRDRGPARQDRRRPGHAGDRRREARCDLFVAVRPRPRALRARGRAARRVQGPPGVQPARRRARVPRSAEGRGAGRLVGDRLSVVRDRHAGAPALPRHVPEEIQRLPAAGLGGRLCDGQGGRGGDPQGRLDGTREDRRARWRASTSTRRSGASPSARSTTSRRWAPTSARRRSATARA